MSLLAAFIENNVHEINMLKSVPTRELEIYIYIYIYIYTNTHTFQNYILNLANFILEIKLLVMFASNNLNKLVDQNVVFI